MLKRAELAEIVEPGPAYPRLRAVFLIALVFWAAIVANSSLSAVVRGYVYGWANVPLDALLISYAALVSLGVYLFLRRITRLPFHQQVVVTLVFVICLAVPFDAGFAVIKTFAGPDADTYTLSNVFVPHKMLAGALFWLVAWSFWSAGVLAMLHNLESRRREQRLAAVQSEAHEAQVRALRYQVNPHFLYNTLSSISTLILEGQSEVAEKMIMRLSAFFRTSLAQDPFLDVRLADELGLQRLYLEIEQMRFADSLRVDYDVPKGLHDALVPSLILQPLVENSIKHGMQGAGKMTTLSLSASTARNRLVLEVVDDGAGAGSARGTGVGLRNVQRRLAARFGTDWQLEAGPRDGGGFRVRLELPLVFA